MDEWKPASQTSYNLLSEIVEAGVGVVALIYFFISLTVEPRHRWQFYRCVIAIGSWTSMGGGSELERQCDVRRFVPRLNAQMR